MLGICRKTGRKWGPFPWKKEAFAGRLKENGWEDVILFRESFAEGRACMSLLCCIFPFFGECLLIRIQISVINFKKQRKRQVFFHFHQKKFFLTCFGWGFGG
jgi:hypothetical protein